MLPLLLAASLWAREADAQTVQPSVSFTKDSYPVWENAGTVTVTVKLASTRSTSTTVRISATQNTAIAGSDFVGFTDVDLSIPAGGLTASRTIQIFNDTAYENGDWPRGGVADGEEFFVSVVSVNGDTSLGGAETKVVIADDEYTACFHAKTYLVGEGAGVYSLALRLSRQLPFPVKVTNAVVDYLSTEGVDYEVLKGTHTFKPWSQDGAFEIWIKDDKDVETNELFRITALVPSVPDGEVFCSTDIIIQENDVAPEVVEKRTIFLEKTNRKGEDIVEGADGALGNSHFVSIGVSAGAQFANGADYVVEVCATSTTATPSADNTHMAGEDFVVQNTATGNAIANGCHSTSLAHLLNAVTESAVSALQIKAFGDTVAEAPETVTVTLTITNNPGGLLELGTSTLTYTIRDNPDQRTIFLEKTNRKGEDIVEGADGALGNSHFVSIGVSAGAQFANGADYVVEVCATSTTATPSADNTHMAGEDFVVQNTATGNAIANGCHSTSLAHLLNAVTESAVSALQIKAFGDTVAEAPETVTVTLTITNNPGGLLQLGTSTLTYTIRDEVVEKRTIFLEKTNRKGEDIVEGADGALGNSHFVSIGVSAGAQFANGADYVVEVCATSTTATPSADNTHMAGEDFVVQNTATGNAIANGCHSTSLAHLLNAVTESAVSALQIKAFGDTVAEAPETVTVTLTITNNPGGLLELGTSTLTYTIRDNPDQRTIFLEKTNRKGEDIVEGADGALGNSHFVSIGVSAGAQFANGADYVVEVCATSTTATPSADNTHMAGEDFVVQNTATGNAIANGCHSTSLAHLLNAVTESAVSALQIKAFGDTVHEEPETVTVTLTLTNNPGGLLELGTSTLTYTIGDIPPATTEFKLLDGGRSISLNEGQEATHKVVIGKPAAQTALPCFTWEEPSVLRDVLFDRGKALDSNGCMKSWPGTPHVGYVIMDLYINTNDDSLAGPNPRFDIGLKTTRKDGSAEPGATANSIGVTVVNDDHSEVVMVQPHPAPMTWVEVKEFFDNLSATAEDRKFSDGTFCNAETPGTRTVTAPGGSGSTRTCVKYFARHATHLKWSTGRATPFSYILRAWGPGEGGGRNFVTIAANTGYSAGQTALDQTAFACNSPEQRAREITISVREAADWSNELSSPALAPGSAKFPICAHEMPGRDYTYTDGSSLPVGVRSEPPPDVDQYPATEGAYAELPRAEILVAESTPYVDIRNARKTKFVKEGRRARFFVELSAEATQDVAVEWRVRPSVEHPRATLGEDVEKASGTLVIAQGETRGEIRVKTYEDSHDDDREKFRVRITSAEGAVIRQQRAHAIIRNDDPMPAAWLARFGRTVAEQALDGIAGRMAAPRTAGMQGTLAGRALSFDAPANDSPGSRGAGFGHAAFEGTGSPALTDVAQAFGSHSGYSGAVGIGQDTAGFGSGFDGMQPQSRGMTGREALLGSSFSLTGAADGSGGSMAFWGRAAQGRFDGGEGTFSLDGEVTTGMLGADYARGKWLVGLALAQSTGEGDYRDTGTAPRPGGQGCPEGTGPLCGDAVREGDGSVEASLTAAIPYAALQASERLKLWGAAGYGTGEVTLKTAMGGSYRADTAWSMAAAGLRGDLLEAPAEGSGPALAVTSDALWTRTSSEKTRDLAASASDATRLRLGLEGSYRMALEGGGHLTPKLEIGARHDGGDAETGFGVELGGGIAWVDPGLGLSLDVSGRTLIAHGNDDLKDRGYAASLAFDPDPATQRGASLSLRQEFGGQANGGLDALFQPATLEDRTGSEATSRWSMEAYGFPAFGGRWTGSPHVGLGLATGARDYSLGWRLVPEAATAPDLSFGLKATRRESDTAPAEHTVGVSITARW